MNNRLKGHLDALQEAGIDHSPHLLIKIDDILLHMHPEYRHQELERIRKLVEQAGEFSACYTLSPTGLQTAIQLILSKVDSSGRKIEVATYDDVAISELSSLTDHVTVVKQPAYQMGWEAARLLIETIQRPNRPSVQMTLQSEIFEQAIDE